MADGGTANRTIEPKRADESERGAAAAPAHDRDDPPA